MATDALLAADAAVICVGPDPAAAVLASPYLHAVEAAGTPAVIFVNRIDEATGRVRDIVAALQDYAEHPIVLRQIPIRDGEHGRRLGRPGVGAGLGLSRGRAVDADRDPGRAWSSASTRRGASCSSTCREFDDHLLEELIEDQRAAERRGLRDLRAGARARTG